jgi:ASC-1-like (ASCH) protein
MEISVVQPWLDHIRAGRKTVEGRLNRGQFAELAPGSLLLIAATGEASQNEPKTTAVVTKVVRYPSFVEYLSEEGLDKCLPGIQTINQGVGVYRQFYTAEQEEEHGVLAIHIRVVVLA